MNRLVHFKCDMFGCDRTAVVMERFQTGVGKYGERVPESRIPLCWVHQYNRHWQVRLFTGEHEGMGGA